MPQLITIYWRDIPSQVIAKHGRKSAKVRLSARFQEAIDKAAMRAGRQGSDEYLEDWRRAYEDCGPDLEEEANTRAQALETQQFSDDELKRYVKAKGLTPEANPNNTLIKSIQKK